MSSAIPSVIDRYFVAIAQDDTDALVSLFALDATVLDEGNEYRGPEAIRTWREGSAFEYTTTVTSTVELTAERHRVTARLVGDFPGGTVMLRFDFTTAGGRIGRLAIAP